MIEDTASFLIAADGGGTGCRMALRAGTRRVELQLGRANVHSDPDGAAATLRDGLDRIVAMAGYDQADMARAIGYFGLAGANAPAAAARVARGLPLARVRVEDDRRAAVVGALGDDDGTLAGIGTGSFFARQNAGAVDLRGGWGFLLGDEASGGWLGRLALARVLHAADGLAPHSDLTRALAARFGGPQGILDFVADARPGDVAALAPDVVAAAEAGDETGADLMRAGAEHIRRAAAALGWHAREPFCAMGGLGQAYLPWLPVAMREAVRAPRGSALDGALVLAARLAAEQTP
jgi:glucosamine kinase